MAAAPCSSAKVKKNRKFFFCIFSSSSDDQSGRANGTSRDLGQRARAPDFISNLNSIPQWFIIVIFHNIVWFNFHSMKVMVERLWIVLSTVIGFGWSAVHFHWFFLVISDWIRSSINGNGGWHWPIGLLERNSLIRTVADLARFTHEDALKLPFWRPMIDTNTAGYRRTPALNELHRHYSQLGRRWVNFGKKLQFEIGARKMARNSNSNRRWFVFGVSYTTVDQL